MSKFSPGDTWEDEDNGMAWQIQEVRRKYVVKVRPVDGNGTEQDVERAVYPESSLERKVEDGTLQPVTEESDDEESGKTYPCKWCDDTFDSQRGLETHVGMAHEIPRDTE